MTYEHDSIVVQPVILCGGSGTRLWPLSRTGFPKQFLSLTGTSSLFQLSLERLSCLADARFALQSFLVVTGEEHRFLALEQMREVGAALGAAMLEPIGRNTAPALTLAALHALESGQDPVLVVIPSDQTMADTDAFVAAVHKAIVAAAQGSIVILGVTPDRPETGYGYIQVQAGTAADVATVQRFVEKPDLATAQSYLQAGGFYWNAGMFVLKASVWLAALEQFRPDIAEASQAAWLVRQADSQPGQAFVRPDRDLFAAIPSESIDYAVMEHCPGSRFPIQMVPLDAGWSDVGAWDAVWSVLPKDEAGNAHLGDVVAVNCKDTLVHASSRLVSVVGVEGLVVVETPDVVLVTKQSCSQDVKLAVAQLNKEQRGELALHRKVQRPWGWYDSVDEGGRFKVKHIQVKPKASLSLQKHYHRAEHWVVVKGAAEITCGDNTLFLTENQSTFIPVGETHRLHNPGSIPLELIEVQSGSYLGEDDIVRLEDVYGRLK